MVTDQPAIRVFAVASAGGHWQQLLALRDSFKGCQVLFASTFKGPPAELETDNAVSVPDISRSDAWRLPFVAIVIGYRLSRFRPDVVISTGALPGVLALVLGKLFGARTIWVDSIANAEEMSMSGKLARRFADLWLSQWPEVAEREGADYLGAVL